MSSGPQDATAVASPPNEDDLDAQVATLLEGAGFSEDGSPSPPTGGEPVDPVPPEPAADTTPGAAADDTPPEPAPEPTPEPVSDDGEPEPPPAADDQPPAPAGPTPVGNAYDRTHGTNYSPGSTSDAQVMAAVEQDASLGRHYRQHATDFQEFLDSKKPAEPTPASPAQIGEVPELPEFKEEWVVSGPDGQPVPAPGAPHDAVQRHTAYEKALAGRGRMLLQDPAQFIAKFSGLDQHKQETAAQTEAQQRESVFRQWSDSNAGELYDDKGAPTPLAARVVEKLNGFRDGAGGFRVDTALAYESAMQLARGEMNLLAPAPQLASPKAARTAPKTAIHQPEAAAPPEPTFETASAAALKRLAEAGSENMDGEDFVAVLAEELEKAGLPALDDE